MEERTASDPPGEVQDEARRRAFHEAVRRLDLLRAAGRELGFEEPELEAAFERHAKADTFGVAFPLQHRDELPEVTHSRELEREFVQLAARRWQVRTEELPRLNDLAEEAARLHDQGHELTPLRVRRVLALKNSYEERLERRRERLERGAERAKERSQAAYDASNRAVAHIPLGQPILVGHHSERGHRRDLERAHRAMDRFVAEAKKAEHLEQLASRVGKGGISSDDPDATSKLQAELRRMEERREMMKHTNAQFRKGGWDAVDGLGDAVKERLKADLARAPWQGTNPFPAYALSNLGANIRRVRARLEELEARALAPEAPPLAGQGYVLQESPEDNRIRFVFASKPDEATRTILKRNGFRWARSEGAWQRQLNDAGRAAASSVRQQLDDASPS